MKSLVSSIIQLRFLQHLDLSQNALGRKGAQAIAQVKQVAALITGISF
jgi:hypothetical protein